MTGPTDLELMQLHDDELDDSAAADLEMSVATDARAAGVLAGLEQVGEVVRFTVLESVKEVDLAETIMSRIGERPALEVVDVDALERGRSEPDREAGARHSVGAGRWVTAVAVLAAAAAAVLMVRQLGGDRPTSGSAQVATERPARIVPLLKPLQRAAEPAAEVGPAVAIETIDFGSHGGTIFMVSAGEETTPVVWVTDDVSNSETHPL